MNWLNKLERKFGRYAIPNLMIYIVALYVTGYVLNMINPSFYMEYLSLNAQAILHGQVWRILTFIIAAAICGNLIWLFFSVMLYYFIGKQLEMLMGNFSF